MFSIILFSVLRHGNNDAKEGKLKKLIKKATITFVLAIMFGVGWIFGVLGGTGITGFAEVSQFIFVGVVALQGILIFVLHPCRSKDAREEWKKWLYYITCRAQAYKDNLKLSKVSQGQSSEHSTSTGRRQTMLTSTGSSTVRQAHRPTVNSTLPGPSKGRASIAARFGAKARPDSSSTLQSHRPSLDSGTSSPASTLTSKPGGAASMAARFGFTGHRSSSDTVKKEDLSLPGISTSSTPVQDVTTFEEGDESSYGYSKPGSISSASPLPQKAASNIQVSLFNSSGEPVDLGEDAESSSQYGNVIEYASSDMFSQDSDPFMLANFHAQQQEEEEEEEDSVVTPTFDYDEEMQSGTATVFYNFM